MYAFIRTGILRRSQRIAIFVKAAVAVAFSIKNFFPCADTHLVIVVFFSYQAHQLQSALGVIILVHKRPPAPEAFLISGASFILIKKYDRICQDIPVFL